MRKGGDTLTRRIGRPWLTGGLLALLIAAVVIAVVVIGPATAAEAPQTTVTAQRGVVQKTVSADGSLEPGDEADVNFDAAGTVRRIYVAAGDHVQKGQLLARLDGGDAADQLDQAQAQLDAAEANLASAEAIEVGNSSSGDNSGSGSSQPSGGSQSSGTSKESKAASVASARADVDSAQLSVDDAEQALGDTALRAPMDGVVASISGAVGQQVSGQASSSGNGSSDSSSGSNSPTGSSDSGSGSDDSSSSGSDTAFITIANLDTLTVSVSFSEADITDVKVGQTATITVNALSDKMFAAKVTGIGILSSDSSGVVSYPVTLEMLQKDSQLKPGMTGTADVIVDQAAGAVTVPSRALTGNTVTVKTGDKTETRTVTTGLVGDSTTQILSGLQPGEEVVLPDTASSLAGAASGGDLPSAAGARGALGGGGAGPVISGGPTGGAGGPQVFVGPGG